MTQFIFFTIRLPPYALDTAPSPSEGPGMRAAQSFVCNGPPSQCRRSAIHEECTRALRFLCAVDSPGGGQGKNARLFSVYFASNRSNESVETGANLNHCRSSCPLTLSLLCIPAAVCTGCAAVFSGSTQSVRFDSIPPGADASYANGNYLGATPVQIQVPRSTLSTVVVKKDGYQDANVFLDHKPQGGWFAWDLATCIIPVTLCLPLLIDAVTGAWFQLDPQYTVKLSPTNADSKR